MSGAAAANNDDENGTENEYRQFLRWVLRWITVASGSDGAANELATQESSGRKGSASDQGEELAASFAKYSC